MPNTIRVSQAITITGQGSGPTVGELVSALEGVPNETNLQLRVNPGDQREPASWSITANIHTHRNRP